MKLDVSLSRKKKKKKTKLLLNRERLIRFGRRRIDLERERRGEKKFVMEDRFIRGAQESNRGTILIGPRIDGRPSLLDFVLTGGGEEKETESMGSNLVVDAVFEFGSFPPPSHPSTRTNLNYICL